MSDDKRDYNWGKARGIIYGDVHVAFARDGCGERRGDSACEVGKNGEKWNDISGDGCGVRQ